MRKMSNVGPQTCWTDIVGATVKPKIIEHVGSLSWLVNDPNVNGEHEGRIAAAYMKDGSLAIVVVTPTNGKTFETYLTNVDVVR